MERWETADDVIANKRRLIAAMPGFAMPASYTVARRDGDGVTLAHVNEVGGTHELPAAVLATVCGYRSGNATIELTRDEFVAAIRLLAPAEPCKAFEHPNLWSWRRLLAEAPPDASFAAVFIGELDAAQTSDDEAELRRRLTSRTLEPGTPVTLERRKWPELPHYRHRGTVIGTDEHGVWIAVHPQSFFRGEEFAFEAKTWSAQLVPPTGGWWAAFLPRGGAFDLYVDIGTPPQWDGTHVSMFDLDLDVVRWSNRPAEIVDRDEFAAHAGEYGYPPELIADAEATAERIHAAVVHALAPFDETGPRWLARVLTSAN